MTQGIQVKLQHEISDYTKNNRKGLIFEHLVQNEWWIRSHHAKMFCKELKLKFTEPEYYRDVYIWLPDLMYGTAVDPIRLTCPTCRLNDEVGVHGFSDHYGMLFTLQGE